MSANNDLDSNIAEIVHIINTHKFGWLVRFMIESHKPLVGTAATLAMPILVVIFGLAKSREIVTLLSDEASVTALSDRLDQ